ncbi:DUF1145 domain-containing protein [Pseudomonas sp. RIT-PI-AD]|uniref:DUF1145 domain-containing protein n=1 Tax=Pseudomonas sp. RIT-PI-AD TaxID=3035294 RepID=UPI0021D95D47|nr:DUF1145 domain-containing protein [Pseudomonas sp. RIT-PI-AD]
MKSIWGIGKAFALLFWAAVVTNLVVPFAHPIDLLLSLAGGLVLGMHLIELAVFRAQLRQLQSPGRQRLQVLLFGVFHLLAVQSRKEQAHA